MFIFNRWSRQQDVNREDRALRQRFKMLAGPGIIFYVFSLSFAVIDWVMSISPHWASTIYGFLFVAGQLISSMALMAIIVVFLARTGPWRGSCRSAIYGSLAACSLLSTCSGRISLSRSC